MERRLKRIAERFDEKTDERSEVLEATLHELSEQLSMLTDEIRSSLDALEKANGH